MIDVSVQERDLIWERLFENQIERVRRYACKEYLEGFEMLGLPRHHVPEIAELNAVITPRTGWRVAQTSVRYSDATEWYPHFARREFLVTDYMRSWEELDFTPEPDMFHDIFGHLPFMVLPEYTAIQDLFAPAFLRADEEERENIKRLAWFSTEFGLIRENGALKVLGAGLISSAGEMEHVLAGGTPIEPFTVENVLRHDKAIWSFNGVFFAADSLAAVREELERYFASV